MLKKPALVYCVPLFSTLRTDTDEWRTPITSTKSSASSSSVDLQHPSSCKMKTGLVRSSRWCVPDNSCPNIRHVHWRELPTHAAIFPKAPPLILASFSQSLSVVSVCTRLPAFLLQPSPPFPGQCPFSAQPAAGRSKRRHYHEREAPHRKDRGASSGL